MDRELLMNCKTAASAFVCAICAQYLATAQPCPPGYYSTNGLAPCVPAPPGYYVPNAGATNPTPASPGYYVPGYNATTQFVANAGAYCPIPGMSSAIPAPPGYIAPSSASTAIIPAAPGTYAPGFGNFASTPDPAGRYTPIAGMAGTITAGDLNNDGIVSQAELNAVLTNYWPYSPWLSMTNFGEQCGGKFQFALTNASAWNFSVLFATNLPTTNWNQLGVAYPIYQFSDPAATNGAPQRFYRLRWP